MAAYELVSRAASLPKAGKSAGEDSHFATGDTVGVADGVGGWSKAGIDAGKYARSLMTCARQHSNTSRDPQEILWASYNNSADIPGSATACVVVLEDGVLTGAVVGDCGYMPENKAPLLCFG